MVNKLIVLLYLFSIILNINCDESVVTNETQKSSAEELKIDQNLLNLQNEGENKGINVDNNKIKIKIKGIGAKGWGKPFGPQIPDSNYNNQRPGNGDNYIQDIQEVRRPELGDFGESHPWQKPSDAGFPWSANNNDNQQSWNEEPVRDWNNNNDYESNSNANSGWQSEQAWSSAGTANNRPNQWPVEDWNNNFNHQTNNPWSSSDVNPWAPSGVEQPSQQWSNPKPNRNPIPANPWESRKPEPKPEANWGPNNDNNEEEEEWNARQRPQRPKESQTYNKPESKPEYPWFPSLKPVQTAWYPTNPIESESESLSLGRPQYPSPQTRPWNSKPDPLSYNQRPEPNRPHYRPKPGQQSQASNSQYNDEFDYPDYSQFRTTYRPLEYNRPIKYTYRPPNGWKPWQKNPRDSSKLESIDTNNETLNAVPNEDPEQSTGYSLTEESIENQSNSTDNSSESTTASVETTEQIIF